MSFKKNLIICALLVVMLMCCVSAVSASDVSSNITLASDDIDDAVGVSEDADDIATVDDDTDDALSDGEDVTIYVDSNYAGENETGTSDNPYKTISGAVQNAGSSSTIFIKNGNYDMTSMSLPGDKKLSFVGESYNGVVLNTNANSAYMFTSKLNNKDLSFVNLIFNNTQAARGLSISGTGNLNIINCTFNNVFMDTNHAFLISNDKSTMQNCIFKNPVGGTKNGIYYIYYSSGTHIMDNISLNDIVGVRNYGNGVIGVATKVILNINELSMVNIQLPTCSGGIINTAGNSKTYMKNSIIKNVTIDSNPSYLITNEGELVMDSCVISNTSNYKYLIRAYSRDCLLNITNSCINNNKYSTNLIHKRTSGKVYLDYNWFGTNEKPYDYVNNWIVVNTSVAIEGNDAIVTGEFTKYTDGNGLYNLTKPLEGIVYFKHSNSINEIELKDGIATNRFTLSDFSAYIDDVEIPLSNIYVDCNFNGTELGTIDNPYKSISKAVSESADFSTIFIKNGNYTENNPITLSNSLRFVGESEDGVIITGGNKGIFNNPFYMSKNIVLFFSDLTIKDVLCTGNNAPISIGTSVSTLNFNNCIFDNCSSKYGSINIASSNAVIDNCKILNSKSTSDVGAICFTNGGNYEIKNSVIANIENVEKIIVCSENDAIINIIDSKIENISLANSNNLDSAIFYLNNNINSTIKNSIISNCQADNIFYLTNGSNILFEQGFITNNNISNLANIGNNSNITINYNILDDGNIKIINNNGSFNLDYNWWGINEKPNDYVNNWVIVDWSLTRSWGSITIRAYMNKYFDGNNTYSLKKYVPSIGAYIVSSSGNFNKTLYFSSGEVQAYFTANDNKYAYIEVDKFNTTITLFKQVYVDCNFNGTELGTFDNPYKAITTAINKAGDGDEVLIKDGEYTLSGMMSSDRGMSLIGLNKGKVIVKLGGNYNMGSSSVAKSLINLTFVSDSSNPSLTLQNSKYNIINCTFEGFKSSYFIYCMSGDVIIDNCILKNSDFGEYYRAIYMGTDGNIIIKNTCISNCSGANVIEGSAKSISIDNVTVVNCTGKIITSSSLVDIKNSKFINNSIVSRIFEGSKMTIENSTIANNTGFDYLAYCTGNYINLTSNVILGIENNLELVYGNVDLDYNWWGTNDQFDERINAWAIFDASVSPMVIAGEDTNVTVTLNNYITKEGVIGKLAQPLPIEGLDISVILPSGETIVGVIKDDSFTFPYTTALNDNVITIKAVGGEVNYTVPLKILKIVLEDNYTATEDANITILAPGLDDSIDLIIDGVKESIQIVDGKAVKTIENIKAGTHSVVAIYIDNGILDFDSKSFVADKTPTEINLEDVTVDVGETVPVEFTIASDATGKVFIDVSGKKSIEYLEDGSLSIDLDLAIGNYTVTLYYEGDGKYDACDDSFKITVNGFNADLKANASDIKVGENAVIDIEINENATGATNVILGDLIIPVIFIDGKATVSIPDLANGTYTATVKFAGDSIFLAAETTVTFTVSKEELPSDINITIDIPEGTTAPEFTVNLPSDATGNFSVTIDNQTYSQPLVNGSATVKVPEQTPGNHTISTAYSGDGKYDGFTSPDSTFNVPKASIPGGENAINMTTPSDSATPSYSIKLPADAKGNLTVTVDGKDTYSKELVNGSATVTVPELPAGKHNITVTYSGDAKYSSISKNTTVNVPEKAKPAPAKPAKVATKITAKNKKFKASKKVKKYTITLKAKGKPVKKVWVTLKVKGKTYKAKTNAKGKATFKIKKLTKKGKYKATIKFAGNKNYKASSKKVKITIK